MRSPSRRLVGLVIAANLVAGCQATPQLRDNVDTGLGTLWPLPPDKASLVRITADAALWTVLNNEAETGWPDVEIDWADGRCVLLAWLERRPMSFDPNPGSSAVYMVRLIDAGHTRVNWVLVDATTGEERTAIGDPMKAGCDGPAVREPQPSRDI